MSGYTSIDDRKVRHLFDVHFVLVKPTFDCKESYAPYAAPEVLENSRPKIRLHGKWKDPVTHVTLDTLTTSGVVVYNAETRLFETKSGSFYNVVTVCDGKDDDFSVKATFKDLQTTCGACERIDPSTNVMSMHDQKLLRVTLPEWKTEEGATEERDTKRRRVETQQ